MKNQDGLTLVTLMLTIIIIIILAAISVYTGVEAYKTIKIQNFIAQMRVIQERINIICEDWQNWDKYDNTLTGTEASNNFNEYIKSYLKERNNGIEVKTANLCTDNAKFSTIISSQTNLADNDKILSNYYYFSSEDLEKYLGLKNLNIEVIINFVTKTFIEKNGIESINSAGDTKTYYLLEDILEAQRLTETVIQNIVKDNEISEYYQKLNVNIVKNSGKSKEIAIGLNLKVELPIKKVEMATGRYDDIKSSSITWTKLATNKYEISGESIKLELNQNNDYNFKITDNLGNVFYSKSHINIELANLPKLEEGMLPVAFEDGQIKEITVNDATWCDYSKDKREWANVTLADNSMYVWIPRFAYKIQNGKVLIKFLSDATDSPISKGESLDGYEVHPAFIGNASSNNGESQNSLTGIWVAKFNANLENGNVLTTYGKNITKVNNFYEALTWCKRMQEDSVYGFGKTSSVGPKENLTYAEEFSYDTHLIKNSEMGALLYLTYSKFGTESYTMDCNKTGIAGGYETEYSVFTNTKYSSTRNAYGVYDIVKSDGEYVASALKTQINNNKKLKNIVNYYLTRYEEESSNKIKGDGIQEFKLTISNGILEYPTKEKPIFVRGFSEKNIFSYKGVEFESEDGYYIRPVITIKN